MILGTDFVGYCQRVWWSESLGGIDKDRRGTMDFRKFAAYRVVAAQK